MIGRVGWVAVLACLGVPGVAWAGPDEKEKPEKKEGDEERIRKVLEKMLVVSHTLSAGNVLTVSYAFGEVKEIVDFKHKGFDKVDINTLHGPSALEIGAGSRSLGRLLHKVTFRGDFEIQVEFTVIHNTPSAILCFLLGKKVGVDWGQTIVKARSLKPYDPRKRPDPNLLKEKRKGSVVLTRKGTTLTVKFNGLESDQQVFKKGELDGIQIGLMARNVRFVIHGIQIRGVVDAKKTK